MSEDFWYTVAWLVFILALAAVIVIGGLASAAEPIHLHARVGDAFYLPLSLPRNQRQPLRAVSMRLDVQPPGILRTEYATGPKRCLADVGTRGVALACPARRVVPGPVLSVVYTPVSRGVATITPSECLLAETPVECPPAVEVEVQVRR